MQAPVLQCAGLYTADNPLSAVPAGALVRAENAVFRYKNRVGPRRGQRHYEALDGTVTTFGSGSSRSREGVFYDGGLVHQYDSDKLGSVIPGVGATDYSGTYTPVDADTLRMKFVETAGNLYLNTNVGNYLLESIGATPAKAGVPTALGDVNDNQTVSHAIGRSGWMAADTACAYRYVWGIRDSHDNVKLGAPSGPVIVRNRFDAKAGNVSRVTNVVTVTLSEFADLQAGDVLTLLNTDGTFTAGSVTVTGVSLGGAVFTYAQTAANATSAVTLKYAASRNSFAQPAVPPGITTSYFCRVYRTEETESADDPPSEECFLVKEVSPTPTDISNHYLPVITDNTPSSNMGPALYTNPNSGDGDAAGKYRPPLCRDMCLWDGRLWCFHTADKHRFHLRLLGIGTPDGVQNNDTITLAGQTYTAKTGAASTHEFLIYSSSDSIAQNIEKTARALVAVINADANSSGTVVAHYESGTDGDPGMLLIEEKDVGGNAFTVYGSRPASWGPALTTSSSGAQTSTNDARPHGASYSDQDEPEAFELNNWLPVGPKGIGLLRGIPFRDKLFVFAENRKVYSVSGQAPYRVDELDGSALLIAPDSVKVHSNQVFALTDQGLGILTDSGFRIVSAGIEDGILDVLALSPETVRQQAFAVSYEADRQYQVWLPESDDAEAATLGYVYNSLRDTWSGPFLCSRTWGSVSPLDGKLYMGDGATNKLRQERKSLDRTDYADEAVPVTISSVSGDDVELSDATGVAAGDMLYVDAATYSLILAVDGDVISVADGGGLAAGEASALKAIPVAVKYAPAAPGGACGVKDFRDCTFHLEDFRARTLTATFDSETNGTEGTAALKPAGGFGETGFGTTPFGNPPCMRNRRVEVTKNHHSAAMLRVGLTISEAWAEWSLLGFTLNHENGGDGGRK